ncbi:MAG: EpsG family protein [Ruminococcaceae bacterium]|nr:EpsG family protein [Oscillospiraceae bacterium]
MFKLLAVFAAALILAYISQKNTKAVTSSGYVYKAYRDWAYVLLVVVLVLFAGLRTSYNDTLNYIRGYEDAPVLTEFFSNAENLNPFKNPLFYLFQSIIKTFTSNSQWLILLTSIITQVCFLRFIKRYSDNFLFSIFIYFTLGTFVFTLAAIKQVTAMAILTLAFPYLEKKKWLRFFLIVLIAMLVHTYAIIFAFIPLFRVRPWGLFTYIFIAVTAIVLFNFETAITAFMEQANDLGKTIADYEVFDDNTINVFRLAVYAVPPLISLICQKWVMKGNREIDNTLIHMSIISFAFMVMGTQAGANMFGRMGNYFELGTICILPSMLKKTFDTKSYKLVLAIACVCFFGFFYYANAVNISFDNEYYAISLFSLLF